MKDVKTTESANQQHLHFYPQAFKCPSCGAVLSIDPNHVSLFCSFCGASLPEAKEILKESYARAEKDAERNLEMERMAHQERQQTKMSGETKAKLIAVVIVFIMFIIAFMPLLRSSFR